MTSAVWFRVLCVAAAGAIGAVLRWMTVHNVHRFVAPWPYGTLAVNIIGCFLFGLAFQCMEERIHVDSHLRLLVFTGLLGGFTTYSSFAFETNALAAERGFWAAVTNIFLHIVLCWGAVIAGIATGKVIT